MRTKIISAAIAVIVTMAIGIAVMPRAPKLSEHAEGDQELITAVRDQLGPGVHDQLSVAVIDHDTIRTATFGAQQPDRYEIGSLNKTFTGSLLAIAIERGEVTADTKVGELLDLGDGPVAAITLQELATQSSGLPRVPADLGFTVRSSLAAIRGSNPYPPSRAQTIAYAREAEVGPKEYAYSNLGMSLLGEALVSAAGAQDYEALVTERITGVLKMTDTRMATADDTPTGFAATGRPAGNWDTPGWAGAVGLRSTLGDMTTYLGAQLDGSAPGVAATEPILDVGDGSRIGYAWMTSGENVVWHNGMTGGFASFAAFDRSADRAVVVLSNTAVAVDGLGMGLMEEDR